MIIYVSVHMEDAMSSTPAQTSQEIQGQPMFQPMS